MNRQGDSSVLQSKITKVLSGNGRTMLSQTLTGRSRRFPLIVVLLGLLLVTAAMLVSWTVNRSMQRLTRASLKSILVAHRTSLEMWLTGLQSEAARDLEPVSVSTAAIALLNQRAQQGEWSSSDLDSSSEFAVLQKSSLGSDLGWAILDLRRNVVASDHPNVVGQTLDIPPDALERTIRQETSVSRPFRFPGSATAESSTDVLAGRPVMCAIAPIVDDSITVGCFAILIDPLARFTELLSVARTGQTGETYAFDRQGTLLSQSRFESHLRQFGLLDSSDDVVSALNVEIRDPGVDLRRGGPATLERKQQPLTYMADQATRGGTGEDVTGYNDYRGVPVVGAWCWLPEYGIGIATEMDSAEAYRPVNQLRRAVYGLTGLIVLSGIGLLLITAASRRLTGRFQMPVGPSRRLGKYELGALIGHGGMGVVYHGRHPLLNRDVAIKVLESDDDLTPQTISRFEREVQLTAQLRHPNTVAIYDFGRSGAKTFYYVMEHIDGITLQELVDRCGRQSPARVIHLLLQVCGSLSEAHGLGMIHRDIKPSNLLVTMRSGLYDMIKVLDFGLVKQIDDGSPLSESSVGLTQADSITGTPMYMSPESVRNATTADARSDLYSVGAVGYILLTGEKLFDCNSSVDVCLKQLNDEPERPSERINQPLPEDLQNVLMSCLRKSPDERPQTADDLADSLRHCHDANGWSASDAQQWWEAGIE